MDENKNLENEEINETDEVTEVEDEVTETEAAAEEAEGTAQQTPEEDVPSEESFAEEASEEPVATYTSEKTPKSKTPVIVCSVLAVLIIAAAVVTTMLSKGIGTDNKFMQSISSALHMNKYNQGYVDITGKTVADLAESQNMELAQFLEQYNLPADMPGSTFETAAYYTIPVSKMAEMYRMDFATLKEVLKLPDTVTEDTTWGEAEGQVKLGDYVGADNLDEFKKQYGLGDEVTADTQWKDVRRTVDEAQRKKRIEEEAAAKEQEKAADTSKDADNADNAAASGTDAAGDTVTEE
ncbi:MAG: hypothetical protein PUB42_07670 [Firmicutes bacterium]|nr:hypothetical protein [Bacillota bacterium]